MFGEGQPRWLMCVGVDTRIGFLCALVQHFSLLLGWSLVACMVEGSGTPTVTG
jgi:hypothetical protein